MARGTSATPRTTRSRRATPLPAIQSAPSFAYGAPGKAELRTQLRQANRDFGEGFEAAREVSEPPDTAPEADDDDEVASLPPHEEEDERSHNLRYRRAPSVVSEKKATRTTTRLERQPEPRIEVPPVRSNDERTATNLDRGARYEHANEADHADRVEPNRARVFRRAFPRYIRALFNPTDSEAKGALHTITTTLFILSGLISLVVLWTLVPLPAGLDRQRESRIRDIKAIFRVDPWTVPPTELQERWFQFQHDRVFAKQIPDFNMPEKQYMINVHNLERIEKLERRVKDLEEQMKLYNETMTALQSMLPSHVVVRVVDGKFEIPDAFFTALRERIAADSDLAPLWQSYMAQNEDYIVEYNRKLVNNELERAIDDMDVITGPQFTKLLKDKFEDQSSFVNSKIQDMQSRHFDEVKEIAANAAGQAANKVIQQYPSPQFIKGQLDKLLVINELYNEYQVKQEVNWFSPNLGARIDPGLTSTSYKQPPTERTRRGLFWFFQPRAVPVNPPITALRKWDETSECWCASREDDGHSQINVYLPHRIYPTKFTIEHIPPHGTQDIKAAPREFEIWAKVDSDDKQKAQDIANQRVFAFDRECSSPPSKGYVCIAAYSYDIHAPNWVQSYWLNHEVDPFSDDAKLVGVRSKAFTIKVVNNYGGNYTCLYRLRMNGQKLEGMR